MNTRTTSFTARLSAAALTGALMLGAALAPSTAHGQAGRMELRSLGGAFIPTGDQRTELKNAPVLGVGAGYRLTQSFTLVGSVAWFGSKAKLLSDEPKVNVYQYDVGAEYRIHEFAPGDAWRFRPFVGGGIGGRTYDTDREDAGTQTNFVGYGSLGLQVGYRKLGFYVEGRDYVSSFKGLTGTEDSSTRNDVYIRTGMILHF